MRGTILWENSAHILKGHSVLRMPPRGLYFPCPNEHKQTIIANTTFPVSSSTQTSSPPPIFRVPSSFSSRVHGSVFSIAKITFRKEGRSFGNWGKKDRFLTGKVKKMQKESRKENGEWGKERRSEGNLNWERFHHKNRNFLRYKEQFHIS